MIIKITLKKYFSGLEKRHNVIEVTTQIYNLHKIRKKSVAKRNGIMLLSK